MARQPKPWFRTDRGVWCVTIDGVRHNLGPNRRDAFAHFRELQRQPARKRTTATRTSLILLADEFLDWVDRNRAPATYRWYRDRLEGFLTLHADLSAEELRPYHVEKWANQPGHSKTTRRNSMRAVKRCLKWAVAQGHLDHNPIEHLEVPSGESRDLYFSPEEFEQLLAAVPDPGFAELLRVTYETGCRPQESLRVEARHVDPVHPRWVFPPREAKGKSMPRVVYLSDYANQVTRRLARLQTSGPLFRNVAGRPWTKDAVGCAFDRLQIRVGKDVIRRQDIDPSDSEIRDLAQTLRPSQTVRGAIVAKSEADLLTEARRKLIQRKARQVAPRCSLYALRHSWATNALRRGIDALTVAVLMGHKDPSTLARTYQHLSHDPGHLAGEARRAIS